MTNESIIKFFFRAKFPIRLKLIALLWAACVTVTVSGWMIFKILTHHPQKIIFQNGKSDEYSKDHANDDKEKKLVASAPEYANIYELKPLSFPITDRRKIRIAYVQVNLAFDMPSKEAIRIMELNRAKLMDILLEVAGQFYIEDFDAPLGFETLKGTLVGRYREAFKENAPREISIRDWLLH